MTAAPHVPVLLDECIDLLAPAPGRHLVDGTFGFGGHSRVLLEHGAEVLGLDLDSDAHAACRDLAGDMPGLRCRRGSFRDLATALAEAGWERCDGVLLDLGVSSLQLDAPAKGFSYRGDGNLDLRFDQRSGRSAARIVNESSREDLADLIWRYGEERASRRIAAALVRAREEGPIETTGRLREIVAGVIGPRKLNAGLSRVFQALRIAVNDELGALAEALAALPELLSPGGRVVVISYHSLEDRIVKRRLADEAKDCLCPPELPVCRCGHRRSMKILTRRPVVAATAELERNPRARSARLRAGERLS